MIGIIHTSFSGNTKTLAEYIKSQLEESGQIVHIFSVRDRFNVEEYDYILFGSLTWTDGKLPIQMRKLFRNLLIDEPKKLPNCSLFGTGETQWGKEMFCKAVDEMEYHLTKHGVKVDDKLKIEQRLTLNNTYKVDLTNNFIKNVLKEVDSIEN